MLSTVVVRRKTGQMAQDETTGEEVPVWSTVYTGPFRLGGTDRGSAGTRTENIGGVELQVATRVGHFPASTNGLSDGDYIDITSGENVGVGLRIIEADWQDQSTARRVPVESVTRPSEWP